MRARLAEEVCVSPATVRSWDSGSYVPDDVDRVLALARAMGVSPRLLLTRSEDAMDDERDETQAAAKDDAGTGTAVASERARAAIVSLVTPRADEDDEPWAHAVAVPALWVMAGTPADEDAFEVRLTSCLVADPCVVGPRCVVVQDDDDASYGVMRVGGGTGSSVACFAQPVGTGGVSLRQTPFAALYGLLWNKAIDAWHVTSEDDDRIAEAEAWALMAARVAWAQAEHGVGRRYPELRSGAFGEGAGLAGVPVEAPHDPIMRSGFDPRGHAQEGVAAALAEALSIAGRTLGEEPTTSLRLAG